MASLAAALPGCPAVLDEYMIAKTAIADIYDLSLAQIEAAIKIQSLLQNDGSQPGSSEDYTSFLDIHELFELYDRLYFQGILKMNKVEVIWSSRLTL